MSNQDDISALLVASGPDTSGTGTPASRAPTPQPAPPRRVRQGRDNGDILGVSWLHGAFHAAVFRRQKLVKEWTCPTRAESIDAFGEALDDALDQLGFTGTEMFLLLETENFTHQPENAPVAPAAARVYLQRRVERIEKEQEPMLWVSQPTVVARQEQSYLLHLLPGSFYDQLNRLLLARRLDLTRILPLVVPLHRELSRMPLGKDTPLLLVVDLGETTVVVVGRVGGPLVFYRTILASLGAEPARVGVEVNRSLLYAKQQYGCPVEHVWVMARSGKCVPHLQAKCGADKKITVLPTTPLDWLQTAIKLPARQPVNLLLGYFSRRRRRALLRLLAITACWSGAAALAVGDLAQRERFAAERTRHAELASRESQLLTERDRLIARNGSLALDQQWIEALAAGRLRGVPARFLALVADALPDGVRLTDAQVKWETEESPRWTFRLEGLVEADAESASTLLTAIQGQLERSALRARFDAGKPVLQRPARAGQDRQRFVLQGGLLE